MTRANIFRVASGDLLKVYQNIVALLTDQHREHAAKVAQQLTRATHRVNTPFFSLLVGKVSTYALHKLGDEVARSSRNDFPRTCTETFTKSLGLPCAHQLKHLVVEGLLVTPNLIHEH
jgi:hypothetical protein